ncbi:putative SPX domain-containing protein [Helianthus anomalus]
MHDLNWSFSADWAYLSSMGSNQPQRFLQNLNCVGCPNMKKVLILSVAWFSNLSSLNISLSAYLKEVDVACINLCFLNLSICSSLEILKLDYPRLTSRFLQELKHRIERVKEKSCKDGVLTSEIEFSDELMAIRKEFVTVHGEMVLLKNYNS